MVGDEDQTIYSFTGASSAFLTSFAERWPDAKLVPLVRNYRSTPQVLELANRLIAAEGRTKRLVATRGDGPPPTISRHPSAEQELAALVAWIRARLGEGIGPAEIAVLVRMNAQLAPIEEALTRAGVAYQVRGLRFYARPEVRSALASLRRPAIDAVGPDLPDAVRARWAEAVGYEEDGTPEGDEARERQASLETLLAIVDGIAAADPAADAATVIADLEARAAHEREGAAGGVNLLTYHRAKGLEWDAVFLPSLEEGILPVRQAKEDDAALAEERRLLYVGITRARVHLALSWAERRESRGREARRQPSRFLLDLRPRAGTTITQLAGPPPAERVAAAQRLRRPGVRGAACVADREGPPGGDAPLRHRPRRHAARDRRGPSADDGGAAPREGHGPRQAREVRRGAPRRDRGGPRGLNARSAARAGRDCRVSPQAARSRLRKATSAATQPATATSANRAMSPVGQDVHRR